MKFEKEKQTVSENSGMNRVDIQKVLQNYDLGTLVTFQNLKRGTSGKRWHIIETANGKYFLKQYRKGDYVTESFNFLKFILDNNYPAVKIFTSKNGSETIKYRQNFYALFEFVKGCKWDYNITLEQGWEMGRYLGRLHVLGINYNINRTYANGNYFYRLFQDGQGKDQNVPNKFVEALEFMKNNIVSLNFTEGMPESTCHVEFLKRHIVFRGRVLAKVLDWDLVGRDYMLNDLGTTMTTAIQHGLDYNLLARIVNGYNVERNLNSRELENLYEAMTFGVLKNAIWAIHGNYPNWNDWAVNNLREFLQHSKDEFNKNIFELIRI